jgi:hypothetical protein
MVARHELVQFVPGAELPIRLVHGRKRGFGLERWFVPTAITHGVTEGESPGARRLVVKVDRGPPGRASLGALAPDLPLGDGLVLRRQRKAVAG